MSVSGRALDSDCEEPMRAERVRPEDLAREIGVSGKTLRAWLREEFPRPRSQFHKPWYLEVRQAEAARRHFSGPGARQRRADTREGMTVTTVALHDDVHRRLSIAACNERMAMTEAVRQAVEEWLARRGKRRGRKT